jgi:hypothetical protein
MDNAGLEKRGSPVDQLNELAKPFKSHTTNMRTEVMER